MISRNGLALESAFWRLRRAGRGRGRERLQLQGRKRTQHGTLHPGCAVEVINGLTNEIEGSLELNGKTFSGSFAVPVTSIKTGNGIRDEHLAGERWLNAAKTPKILFSFKDAQAPAFADQKPLSGSVKGSFTVNGVTRQETVSYTATWFKESESTKARGKGDLLRSKPT
jgi:hypothetical protein